MGIALKKRGGTCRISNSTSRVGTPPSFLRTQAEKSTGNISNTNNKVTN
jgi:hypothetical protein